MRGVGKTQLAAAYAWAKLARAVAAGGLGQRRGSGQRAGGFGRGRGWLGLRADAEDARRRAGRCGTGWRADGERCLLVFDNAADPGLLRPYIPAAGVARVIITSNQLSVAKLGTGVPVDVFTGRRR